MTRVIRYALLCSVAADRDNVGEWATICGFINSEAAKTHDITKVIAVLTRVMWTRPLYFSELLS